MAKGPMMGEARAVKMFSWLSSLFSPFPVSPIPANIMVAMLTRR